jgi:hypothetical protein
MAGVGTGEGTGAGTGGRGSSVTSEEGRESAKPLRDRYSVTDRLVLAGSGAILATTVLVHS